MSRSPYVRCSLCSEEYDGSGYYGTDDEAHYCRQKLEKTLRFLLARFPDLDNHLTEIQARMAEEARQQEIKLRREKQERLRTRREVVIKELAQIDSELQEFSK